MNDLSLDTELEHYLQIETYIVEVINGEFCGMRLKTFSSPMETFANPILSCFDDAGNEFVIQPGNYRFTGENEVTQIDMKEVQKYMDQIGFHLL